MRWVGVGGYEVEAIVLDGRPRLRVSLWAAGKRLIIAYCRTAAEVAQHVDLADLVEVVELKR